MKPIPTASERLRVYRKAYKALEGMTILSREYAMGVFSLNWQVRSSGLCELIMLAYTKGDTAYMEKADRPKFPEFDLFNPQTGGFFWWESNDREARRNCLSLCIEMAKDAVKEEKKGARS